jgi:hypothetical protein
MSLSPKCAARSRRSRALIILLDQPLLVELGMPAVGSCATPVVPEFGGGKAGEKTLDHVVEGPDSINAHPRPG